MARKTARISQEALCEIAGVSISTRRDWVRKNRLRSAGRAKYEEQDAIELAALGALVKGLGPTDAAIAWKQIERRLNAKASEDNLVVVYDFQDKEASLETSIRGLRSAHTYGHRTGVVDLADPIDRVKLAFRRLTEDV